ncbi:hypothetical protein EZV62_012111 [Acer yangbiense]|uniref:Uncharacterized protein n=1 Tax=Acer yangbiense TaxID=1000413 RepID=A0A5C7HVD0_9ROSI|nr:hypothetical protein EZV62_012111 [Acer yangbiense]
MTEMMSRRLTMMELGEGSGKEILGASPTNTNHEPRKFVSPKSASKVYSQTTLKPPKLSFPKFDGEDPGAWIRKFLGMQWLGEIGHLLLDAKKLSMKFKWQNKLVNLQGIKEEGRLTVLEGKRMVDQLWKAQQRAEPVVHLYSLKVGKETEEVETEKIHEELVPILETYTDIFAEPTTLPPNRSKDHHIPFIPISKPINGTE